ncbi:MAG: hypothetical protein MUE30_18070 [Spirosomaceae bacterium]|nr:hypothetical protein [Spirosomataceae bacterium]
MKKNKAMAILASNTKEEMIPPLKKHQLNIYNPSDIKRWGVTHFLNEVCSTDPIKIPDFRFTDNENKLMDETLSQEKDLQDNDI